MCAKQSDIFKHELPGGDRQKKYGGPGYIGMMFQKKTSLLICSIFCNVMSALRSSVTAEIFQVLKLDYT
jgi:hypothetical protein